MLFLVALYLGYWERRELKSEQKKDHQIDLCYIHLQSMSLEPFLVLMEVVEARGEKHGICEKMVPLLSKWTMYLDE